MERVIKFVNEQFKHAGNSREVQNQKEELIASLHDKIFDAMSRGKSEDKAFDDAMHSLGSMEELTEELSGKRRTVYVNRLNFDHSLIAFGLIMLEIRACGAYYLMGWVTCPSGQQSWLDMPYFDTHTVIVTFIGIGIALFATTIYPLVCGIIYRKNPGKVKQVEFDFHKRITIAFIGWLAVLLGLAIINMAPIPKDAGPVIWFIWPMIGVANWPLSLVVYNKLFKSRRYVAEC
jgi:hypothetical protein